MLCSCYVDVKTLDIYFYWANSVSVNTYEVEVVDLNPRRNQELFLTKVCESLLEVNKNKKPYVGISLLNCMYLSY